MSANYQVDHNPFRIIFNENRYCRVGKIKRDFKGKYRCEVKACPVRAQINRLGKFYLILGQNEHKNHAIKYPFSGAHVDSGYGKIKYYVQKKPFKIIVGVYSFINEHPVFEVNNYNGFYRCEEQKCPLRMHIDRTGILRYINNPRSHSNDFWYAGHNHKLKNDLKNNYSYVHYDMMRFYVNALPVPNCKILENPLRVVFRDQIYVKDGVIGEQYRGNYRCAVKSCKARLQIGFYGDVRWFRNMTQDHSRDHFHNHPKPVSNENRELKNLYSATLDVNRYDKKTIEKFGASDKVKSLKPKVEKSDKNLYKDCICNRLTDKQLHPKPNTKRHNCEEYARDTKSWTYYSEWKNSCRG